VIWISHTNDATSTLESIKDTPLDFFSGNNNLKPEGDEKFVPKSFGSRCVCRAAFLQPLIIADRLAPALRSFYETDLDNYLKSKGIKDIVLVGYQPQCTPISTISPPFPLSPRDQSRPSFCQGLNQPSL
jgi:hypothetical protein